LAYTYDHVATQLDDEDDKRPHDIRAKEGETKAERASRMTGVFKRGMEDHADAQHSNDIPAHKPFSLSYTYDHVKTQLNDDDVDEVVEPIKNAT
jgi:hypothetical protein